MMWEIFVPRPCFPDRGKFSSHVAMAKRKAAEDPEVVEVQDAPKLKGMKRTGKGGKAPNEVNACLELLTTKLEASVSLVDSAEAAIHVDCVLLLLNTLLPEEKLSKLFVSACIGVTQSFVAALVSACVHTGVSTYVQAVPNLCALSKHDVLTAMQAVRYAQTIPQAASNITLDIAKSKLSIQFEGDPEVDHNSVLAKDLDITIALLRNPVGPPDVLAALSRMETELAYARKEREVSHSCCIVFRVL